MKIKKEINKIAPTIIDPHSVENNTSIINSIILTS